MTNKEFIDKIKDHRHKAQFLIEGNGGFDIKRGMAHTISGYVEDLFALFIAKKINSTEFSYLVDKVTSIRFNEGEKAKSFKPDLSIIKKNVLTHYFDVKTNMGWNRHFDAYLEEKNDFISTLQGNNAWIWFSKDNIQHIAIDDQLVYQMVVVYGWNIKPELLAENIEKAKAYENIKVHVLYTKNNDSGDYEVNETAFDNLFKTLPL